jgi:predicted P-loop ATPase
MTIDNLPRALAALTTRSNWLLWRFEVVGSKRTKVPYQPSGRKGSSTDRATWSSYDDAIAAWRGGGFDGVGFALEDDVAAFDIDGCRNIETGLLHPWAAGLVERADSYTEITPSGTGIRIIGLANGNKIHRKLKVDITCEPPVTCEPYRKPAGRYITVSGNQIGDRALVNIDVVMDEVMAELLAMPMNQSQEDEERGGYAVDELEATLIDGGMTRHGPTRSDQVWWVVMEMLRRGYAPDVIKRTISDPGLGISAHVLEQANPRRAVDRCFSNGMKKLSFAIDRNGKKYPTSANIRIAMAKMKVVIRFNKFTSFPMMESAKVALHDLGDNDVLAFKDDIEEMFSLKAPKEIIYDCLLTAGMHNSFHPVQEYLDELQWDDHPRVDRWLIDYCGATGNKEYLMAVGKIILVAAVRRIKSPGCKFDEMMVLEAPQGTEKSSALAILAVREEWFSDNLPMNAHSREVLEQTQGKWIIEAAELSGMRRADIEHLKAFLSRQVDRGRMAYGRLTANVPRQFIIVGTTNSAEYLRDLTGNRRFWPIHIERVSLARLKEDRDQLWAEAVVMERDGCPIRLPERLWPVAETQQEERTTIDPYFEILEEALNGLEGKIPAVTVWDMLNIAGGNRTQDQNQRVGAAMRNLGWRRVKIRNGGPSFGSNVSGYVKGPTPYRLIVRGGNGHQQAHYEEEETPM